MPKGGLGRLNHVQPGGMQEDQVRVPGGDVLRHLAADAAACAERAVAVVAEDDFRAPILPGRGVAPAIRRHPCAGIRHATGTMRRTRYVVRPMLGR